MTDRSRHRRRPSRADDLAAVARARLVRAQVARAHPPGGRGWVPTRGTGPLGDSALDAAARPSAVASTEEAVVARSALPATSGDVAVVHGRLAVGDRLPPTLRAALLAPGARALGGLVLVVGLGLALALAFTWLSRPRVEAVPELRRSRPATAAVEVTPSPTGSVVVHVAGAVRRPGVVELPAGSRVSDAVQAAGGPARRAALASVNLARPLVDGEQLLVLARGQAPPAGASGTAGTAALPGAVGGGLLDLNTATLEQLEELPGVGPVLGQRIIDWRTEHGRFSTVEELTEVSGIGESRLADIKPKVRV